MLLALAAGEAFTPPAYCNRSFLEVTHAEPVQAKRYAVVLNRHCYRGFSGIDYRNKDAYVGTQRAVDMQLALVNSVLGNVILPLEHLGFAVDVVGKEVRTDRGDARRVHNAAREAEPQRQRHAAWHDGGAELHRARDAVAGRKPILAVVALEGEHVRQRRVDGGRRDAVGPAEPAQGDELRLAASDVDAGPLLELRRLDVDEALEEAQRPRALLQEREDEPGTVSYTHLTLPTKA